MQDKLLWTFSNDGDGTYQVKRAYEILMQDSISSWNTHGQEGVWNLIWGVKSTSEINTFIWKLIQEDSLPFLIWATEAHQLRPIVPYAILKKNP